MKKKLFILGAGIAGISTAFHLRKADLDSKILEKTDIWGGLCSNYSKNGFRFDKFIHLSFTQNEYVKRLFDEVHHFKHIPNPYNYFHFYWLKHPAQNNLYPLPQDKKNKIIHDFISRKDKPEESINNYEDWLRAQYGNYFAEEFPLCYTKKYWTVPARELGTKWVGSRMYKPSVNEVIKGAENDDTPITYYAKEMRYPKKGGFKAFLKPLTTELDIEYGKNVIRIDAENKKVYCDDGCIYKYDNLISSIPLPEMCRLVDRFSVSALEAGKKLAYTSGYIVSLGLKRKKIPPYLWFYIYDKEILPARVYSPSLKAPDNVPEGCSSLQAEIYFTGGNTPVLSEKEIMEHTINKLHKMEVINKNDLIVKDIRKEEYANVIFKHNIYENRNIILNELKQKNIQTIGRFGKWDYFWSDQSFLSGKEEAEKLIKHLKIL